MKPDMLIPDGWERTFKKQIAKPAALLAKVGLSADIFSFAGLFLALLAGFAYALGYHIEGGAIYLASGFCDVLDGAVARSAQSVSPFGAFLDSTLDRISEYFVLTGIFIYFLRWSDLVFVIVVWLAIGSSLLVSYVKARAEGLGISCKTGWAQRPVRVVLIGVLSLLGGTFGTAVAVTEVTVLSVITVFQRILYVRYIITAKK